MTSEIYDNIFTSLISHYKRKKSDLDDNFLNGLVKQLIQSNDPNYINTVKTRFPEYPITKEDQIISLNQYMIKEFTDKYNFNEDDINNIMQENEYYGMVGPKIVSCFIDQMTHGSKQIHNKEELSNLLNELNHNSKINAENITDEEYEYISNQVNTFNANYNLEIDELKNLQSLAMDFQHNTNNEDYIANMIATMNLTTLLNLARYFNSAVMPENIFDAIDLENRIRTLFSIINKIIITKITKLIPSAVVISDKQNHAYLVNYNIYYIYDSIETANKHIFNDTYNSELKPIIISTTKLLESFAKMYESEYFTKQEYVIRISSNSFYIDIPLWLIKLYYSNNLN